MSDKLNIDELFKAKLETFSAEPSSHVWDDIRDRMAASKRKRRMTVFAWSLSAAVIALAFMAGWYFSGNKYKKLFLNESQIVETSTNKKEPAVDVDNKINYTAKAKEDGFSEGENSLVEASGMSTASEYKRTLTNNITLQAIEKKQLQPTHTAQRLKHDKLSLLERIDVFFDIDMPEINLEYAAINVYDDEITAYDRILIAENIRKIGKKPDRSEKRWAVGAQVSPSYSSHSVSYGDSYVASTGGSSSKGGMNVGGGLAVRYKINKKISVESGIYYSQDGQTGRDWFDFSGSDDMMYAGTESDGVMYTPSTESDEVAYGPTGANDEQTTVNINSVAGVIKVNGASVLKSAEVEYNNDNNLLSKISYSNDNMSQVFGFVEMPLYVRYNVVDKKLGINFLGGVNTGILVRNNVYYDNDGDIQNIGSTEDISTLNFSTTVGAGFSYALNRHLSLAFEPRFSYYINSINTNSDIDYRPYRLGLYTGVYYTF